jgi:hypothetical protein
VGLWSLRSEVTEVLFVSIGITTCVVRPSLGGGGLAAAAEIEQELILECAKEGQQSALAAGVKFGRKYSSKPAQPDQVKELKE